MVNRKVVCIVIIAFLMTEGSTLETKYRTGKASTETVVMADIVLPEYASELAQYAEWGGADMR